MPNPGLYPPLWHTAITRVFEIQNDVVKIRQYLPNITRKCEYECEKNKQITKVLQTQYRTREVRCLPVCAHAQKIFFFDSRQVVLLPKNTALEPDTAYIWCQSVRVSEGAQPRRGVAMRSSA